MLPIPTDPNISYLNGVVEVEGVMDGGCQEKHTNMQERGSKWGNLTHVLHEGTHYDHSSDLRTPATTTRQQLNSDQQQEKMPQTTITHLPSVGSDHCPLLMEMTARVEDHIREDGEWIQGDDNFAKAAGAHFQSVV
ncbi:hypothetical protein MTR67_006951 [Solanum verrucosum]|uniref:Uncharacterized protein n=1 Tax=Solanum verrucosum TaxID=315347 RepID=A0AAF0TCA9_SOLVR|nr:hypothetical protein MTR67_006951 [Solanum verrucosum]